MRGHKNTTNTYINPSHRQQFLDSPKPKEFAYDSFKFDLTEVNFYYRVENTVGKVEIARYDIFFFSPPTPSALKTHVLQTRKNKGLFGNVLNRLG